MAKGIHHQQECFDFLKSSSLPCSPGIPSEDEFVTGREQGGMGNGFRCLYTALAQH